MNDACRVTGIVPHAPPAGCFVRVYLFLRLGIFLVYGTAVRNSAGLLSQSVSYPGVCR